MAYNTVEGRAEYTATSGQTVFTFTFKIFVTTNIKVYLTPVGNTPDDTADLLTETTDYTVTINGDNGGDVTLVVPATTGDAVTVVRDLDVDRYVEFQQNGDFTAENINNDQDLQTYLVADGKLDISRCFQLPKTVQGASVQIPAPQAGYSFRWDSAGTAIENVLVGANEVSVNILNVDTATDLLAVDESVYYSINMRGYGSANDGGGGLFNWDSTVNKSTANGGTIIDPSVSLSLQGSGVGLGCWVRQEDGPVHVKWFGAYGNESNDDTLAIQRAIDYAESIGGSDIVFDNGSYKISSTITINKSNIVLRSYGFNGYHDAGGSTYSARLIWYGATDGIMVQFSPIEGASNGKLVGCGNFGVTLEGRNVAGYGIIVKSMNNGQWNFHAQQFTQIAFQFAVSTTLGEARDCQGHTGFVTIKQIGSTGIGVHLGGDASANFSLNRISFDIQHQNAKALVMSNSDNNVYPFFRALRASGGTAIGVDIEGGSALAQASRDDMFIHFNPGAGGVTVRGTTSFAVASQNTRVMHYDDQSAGPIVIETGATFYYTYKDNVQVDSIIRWATIAADKTSAKNESLNITTESLRVHNSASNHSRFVDSLGNEWAVGIDGADGSFRILRISGTGNMQLHRKLDLRGQTTATTATAGARTLPTNPQDFLEIDINGVTYKIPYYNV